jgi:hypothetical protein
MASDGTTRKEIMDSKGKPAVERDAIGGDRRQDRRYHLRMELAWKLIRRRRVLDTGIGQTIDISSGGILFDAGRPLPEGLDVELSISWPVLLNDVVAMQLAANGRIVRGNGGQVAIQTVQHEFRTAGIQTGHRNGLVAAFSLPSQALSYRQIH